MTPCTYFYADRRLLHILTPNGRIHPADFVNDDTVKSWGAYNKLCNPPSWPYTGTVKRGDATHLPARRDEKVIGPSLVDAADNCTETRVTPASTWVNYAPNKDFLSAHGHYTVSLTSLPRVL
jgi:hypothetical protein